MDLHPVDQDCLQTFVSPKSATFEKRWPSKSRALESRITIPFRISFDCNHNKFPQQKYTWLFGLCTRASWLDEAALQFEQVEHEVTLIQNMTSGKNDILWNGTNMSHTFHEASSAGMFEYTWWTRTGESVQVIGYPPRSTDEQHFEFLIDGIKYTDLPDMDDLRRCRSQSLTGSDGLSEDCESLLSSRSNEECIGNEFDQNDPFEVVPYDSGFRLSLVGLNRGQIIEDELRSDLPSSALESLREAIVSYFPNAEEMVSRAMLNALLDEAIVVTRPECSSDPNFDNSFQIETEMLREAFEWIHYQRCSTDLNDLKYALMQRHVDAAFVHVQQERMTVTEALRALLSVACLLKLRLSRSVASNTIILLDLPESTTARDLIDTLALFGNIENTAIVQGKGFAVCRFRQDSSVHEVCLAAQEKVLTIHDAAPRIFPLELPKLVEGGCIQEIFETLADCDKCLGSPIQYLLTDENHCYLQHHGLNMCGSSPVIRHDFAYKAGKASTQGTMASVVSIDSITSALVSTDSCPLTPCLFFER